MRFTLPVLTALGLTALSSTAHACAWAGGDYSFKENGIYGELRVNADCTEIWWKRLEEPETVPLARTDDGWRGELERVDVELLENGHSLRIFDGGVMRSARAEPKG
ncbi:MAG: hypothetical protein AB3N23_03560 [Paracoccaceae bacterium]